MLHFLTRLVNGDHAPYEMRDVERNQRSYISDHSQSAVDMHSPSFPINPSLSLQEQHDTLRQLRREMLLRYRPVLQRGSGPIRVMARMVSELEKQCRDRLHWSVELAERGAATLSQFDTPM